MPWLSVLVPTYNGEPYLRSALDSVCEQGDRDVEVLVVDDGSTDGTTSVLREYDDRLDLTVVHGERVGSWVAGTNHALGMARAEWSTVLHQDDVWLTGRLHEVHRAVAPRLSLVVHDALFIDDEGRRVGAWRAPIPAGRSEGRALARRLAVQNFLAVPAVTFRTRAARESGGFDESLWYTADWDMWLRLTRHGDVHRIPEALCGYRVHADALTATRTSDADEMRRQLLAPVEAHLSEVDDDVERRRQQRLATWSAEVNVSLAQAFHGRSPRWREVGRAARALRPADWREYVVASRLRERVSSRARLAIGSGRRRG